MLSCLMGISGCCLFIYYYKWIKINKAIKFIIKAILTYLDSFEVDEHVVHLVQVEVLAITLLISERHEVFNRKFIY